MRRYPLRAALLAAVTLAVAMPAAAQSLFATRGLGLPVSAVDARARALGGIGIGIAGLSTSLVNPADLAGLTRTGVTAALQPSSGTARIAGEEGELDGARFPLARIVFPLSGRVVMTVGYGGVYEQSFGIRTEGTELVGGEMLEVVDEVLSNGGLSELGAGLAWSAGSRLSLGIAGGIYAGNQRRTVTRTFADTTLDLDSFNDEYRYEYRAPFARVGVRWDPNSILRLGASVTVASDLDIEGGTDGSVDESAPLPTRVAFGGSGFLASNLMLAVGAERAIQGGSGVLFEGDPESARVRDTWRVGGGLEFGGLGSGARSWPLRVGGSWAQLPFFGPGEEPAEEWSITGGIGFRLAGDPSDPQAVLDATIERGTRTGLRTTLHPDGLEERFWRLTVSLSLFGR